MPKIDLDQVKTHTGSSYPAPYADEMGARTHQNVGDAAGLTQFGVNRMTLQPGAKSSLRHWHAEEDEFVVVLSGEVVLVEETGETPLTAGDCAGFKAGVENGHHLINRSDQPVTFIAVGTRAWNDTCFYTDVDLMCRTAGGQSRFALRNGRPAE